jgi:predicted ATP-dependent serine protease
MCGHLFEVSRAKCPSCKAWHLVGVTGPALVSGEKATITLSEVSDLEDDRFRSGPWDYLFGGKATPGIVKTSVNLLAGSPGAGKTTIALAISGELPKHAKGSVLYVGAEQTAWEIKTCAKRTKIANMNMIEILPMKALDQFQNVMAALRPIAVVLDSLPGFVSTPEEGCELCGTLKLFAIDFNAPMLVIDHINKQEDFAGLMKLQHAVDGTYTLFPIEKDSPIRIAEVVKNRNGPAQISSLFMMGENGLTHMSDSCDDPPEEGEDEE